MTAMPDYVSPTYLSCADTAKLVRKALKKHFPGYKFSVRSNTYSGGASIDVGWTDGPTASMVDEVVQCFRGGGFDGMIDMKYYVTSWLNPDGSANLAEQSGTEGSRGTVPEAIGDPRSPDAQLVSFGADFIFTNRTLSDTAKKVVDRRFARKFGDVKAGERGWDQWNINQEWRTLAARALFLPGQGREVSETSVRPSPA